jgi:hypothetical protein
MEPWLKNLLAFFLQSPCQPSLHAIGIASGGFLSPALNRIGLILMPPGTNRYSISFDGVAVLDQGITVYPSQNPIFLHSLYVGSLTQRPVTAISATAAQTVQVYEIIAPIT